MTGTDAAGPGTDPAARVLGVDVGGTKVRAAVAGLDGRILADAVEPTRAGDPRVFIGQVVGLRDLLVARAGRGPGADPGLRAAAFAVPVTIDPASGRVGSEQNVPGLRGLDLRADLSAALGLPVQVENDANAAALAEARHGAGAGCRDFVVVAIGTGIGMGIVADGRLLHGAHGGAGEIGFLPIGAEPATAESRRYGAFELSAAGPALRRRIDAALGGRERTVLGAGAGLDEVVAAAPHDAVAGRILADEAALVARGLAAVVAVVDPAIVLLGGGVGAVPGFAEAVAAALADVVARPPRVERAALGDRGPLVGAVDLAIDLAHGLAGGAGGA